MKRSARTVDLTRRALTSTLATALAGAPLLAAAPRPAKAATRSFGVEGAAEAPLVRAQMFPLGEVRLTDGPLREAQGWNLAFIKRIDPDRLLHTFRLNAGLPSQARPLGGWEAPDCELRGHFTGHYLSACALGYASTGDADLKQRGDTIVATLAQCQTALGQGGYVSAFPVVFFERLDANRWVWAPFYTLHKIMAGLLDMHAHAGSAQALTVAQGLAGWCDGWTAARSPAHLQTVLDVEFGGMSEALYNLAAATGDARWIEVGDRFVKARFITPLAERHDELQGLHMNTHVPQVIGAARRWGMTGEPVSGEAAAFFWETVTEARSYPTGGSSNREHWLAPPWRQGEEWGQAAEHQECCCAYNMMKLTRALYQYDPAVRRIDYYERNLFNHRLGTLQPDTGRAGYFLSLAPGAWRTYATDDDTFWCCTGTGIEEFNKLADTIYAWDEAGVFVNLFAASEVTWRQGGVRLEQATLFPQEAATRLTVRESPATPWTLRLRIPGWTTDRTQVRLNGAPIDALAEPGGYLALRRVWRAGDQVELILDMPLRAEPQPDNPSVMAFLEGPIVLAGQFPATGVPAELVDNRQGPAVDKAPIDIPVLAKTNGAPTDLLRRTGPLTYEVATASGPVTLRPFNQSRERYAVYWTVA